MKSEKTKNKNKTHSIMPSGTGGINANFQTEWDKAWTMQIQPHSLELSPSPQMQPCDWEEMAKTVKWRRRECITRGRRRLWRRMSFSEGPSLGLIWNAADSKNCFINHSIPAGWREKKPFLGPQTTPLTLIKFLQCQTQHVPVNNIGLTQTKLIWSLYHWNVACSYWLKN